MAENLTVNLLGKRGNKLIKRKSVSTTEALNHSDSSLLVLGSTVTEVSSKVRSK